MPVSAVTNTESSPDIVVIGGGVTGAFTTYSLAALGARATLVEREGIAAHASGKNPGGLNPLHGAGIPGPMQPLAVESFRLHMENAAEIEELSRIACAPRRVTRTHLAFDEADVRMLDRLRQPYQSALGFSAEWVERDDVLAHDPGVNPAMLRGLRTEGNAKVHPAAYTRAVVEAAIGLGASAASGEALGLRHSGRRVTEVLTDSGSLRCGAVVIATGPWSAGPSRWLTPRSRSSP